MKAYQIRIPTNIFWGRNIWQETICKQQQLFEGNIMVVTTGRSLLRLGYVQRIKEQLEQCTFVKKVTVFDNVSANPRLSEAKEGIKVAKQNKVNLIIGFGGGSALDLAKTVAAGAGVDEDIAEFFYGRREPGNYTLPVIAIPTTAGTGSELSKAAIITDDEKKIKRGIRGDALYPKVAIVDSTFTESVPFNVTMETGFDVLAHAMESYISKVASPFTQMQSEYAVKTVGKMLPRLAMNLKDIEARKEMSYASMIMGINLGNASTGLPHRLQYPLGAFTDTSHGLGLAALYTSWIGCEYQYSQEKIEKIMSILWGQRIQGKDECIKKMHEFIALLQLPTSLDRLGINSAQIKDMVYAVSGNLWNDPASQEEGIITKIYENAWEDT